MDSCWVHGDCVSRNVSITIIFLYVTERMVVLTSIHWRVVLLEKLIVSLKVSQQ